MIVNELEHTLFHTLYETGKIEFLNEDIANALDFDYFNIYSFSKIVQPYLEVLVKDRNYWQVISNSLIFRYSKKWETAYKALLEKDYNIFENNKYTEKELPNITISKENNNEKNNIYNKNSELNSDGTISEGKKITTTNEDSNINNVYGFNNSVSVPNDDNKGTSTETITASKDDNITNNVNHENESVSSSEDIKENSDSLETKSGTIDKQINGLKDKAPQDLAKKELSLNDLYNLAIIMFRDVDNMITLGVY